MRRIFCGVVFAAFASTMITASPAPSIDAAFERFWAARNTGDAKKAAEDVVRSGVTFDDALARLKRGRQYDRPASHDVVHEMRRAAAGDFTYDVFLPEGYDPQHRYQVRFQLHGGVMMREQNEEPGRGRGGPRSPLRGAEQIYVMPAAWREAPWWSAIQLDNLDTILDRLKRTYNVDENRIVVSGVSDGATGTFYVAMRDTTPYASFASLNGSIMVLANDRLDVGGELFPTNLLNKPFFIVNGGRDPLYPTRAVEPYVEHLRRSGVTVDYKPQPDGVHNTAWWPEVKDEFETFVRQHPRNPLPSHVTWEATDHQVPSRAHWIVIERVKGADRNRAVEPRLEPDLNVFTGDGINKGRELFSRARPSGRVDVEQAGNAVRARTSGVAELTVLISPDAFDLSKPVTVTVHDRVVYDARVEPSVATLMKWAARDNDRTMLFGGEIHVSVAARP